MDQGEQTRVHETMSVAKAGTGPRTGPGIGPERALLLDTSKFSLTREPSHSDPRSSTCSLEPCIHRLITFYRSFESGHAGLLAVWKRSEEIYRDCRGVIES